MKSQKLTFKTLAFRKLVKLSSSQDNDPSEEDKETKSHEQQTNSLTQEEELEFGIRDTESAGDGEDSELHVYESRYDTRGEKVYLRAGSKTHFDVPQRRSQRACLVLTRQYNYSGKLIYTELNIQSAYIIQALRDVIGAYNGVDLASNPIVIDEPPRCLFHFQDELQAYLDASKDEKMKSHLALCLRYMERKMSKEVQIYRTLTAGKSGGIEMEHAHLWMALKPGCLIYRRDEHKGVETLLRLVYIEEGEEDIDMLVNSERIAFWVLHCHFVGVDRKQVGFRKVDLKIKRYDGSRPIHELHIFPLIFHPERERLQKELLQRGKKYLSLLGVHHCFYDGLEYGYKVEPTFVKERIIIDVEKHAFREFNEDLAMGKPVFESGTDAESNLSNEDIMTCSALLPGFSLESKKWSSYLVSDVSDVRYNDVAFDALVLPGQKKELIFSLLSSHGSHLDDVYDDLIRGKGRGIVFLLHGPPGVGKTYTVESIADYKRRPLLKLHSGELIGGGHTFEDKLRSLLSLATRWGAVVLIDEADVFMQQRTLNSGLWENSLVSVMLRVLEYFEGILFLTSNRIEAIDIAFKSRIHVPLAFAPLTVKDKAELWQKAVTRANRGEQPQWLTPEILENLADEKTNGREIKNMVRVAASLAQNAKRSLEFADLSKANDALRQFNHDFAELSTPTQLDNPLRTAK